MKSIVPSSLLAAVALGSGLLALNAPAVRADATNPPPANAAATETHITSKVGYLDLNTRSLVYRDSVRVEDPRLTLTCEYLTAQFPTNGGHRVDSIIAETNVVALITTNDITYTISAAKAIYRYRPGATATNETLELTGLPAPLIRWQAGNLPAGRTNEFTARKIVWDLAHNRIIAEDHQGTFPDLGGKERRPKATTPSTNAPANATPEPKPAAP